MTVSPMGKGDEIVEKEGLMSKGEVIASNSYKDRKEAIT